MTQSPNKDGIFEIISVTSHRKKGDFSLNKSLIRKNARREFTRSSPDHSHRAFPSLPRRTYSFHGTRSFFLSLPSLKGRIKKSGSSHDGLFHVVDWFPTLVSMATGESRPKGFHARRTKDSRDGKKISRGTPPPPTAKAGKEKRDTISGCGNGENGLGSRLCCKSNARQLLKRSRRSLSKSYDWSILGKRGKWAWGACMGRLSLRTSPK